MTDGNIPPTDAAPAPSAPSAPSAAAQEIADGKAFAILSYALNYFGLPFWLVPLIMRSNEFSLYHAKQCLTLWLACLVLVPVSVVLIPACGVGLPLLFAVFVASLVFHILGLINAINGKMAPLPLIGSFGEQWFAGIRKA
jgi:uncharacterized membrane protein